MKNKKAIIGLITICVLGIVGATIAYFSTTDIFDNLFGTEIYKMDVYEIFESPTNWRPGDVTPKTIVATNKGNVDAAVRISFEEEWTDSSNNQVSLTDDAGIKAALIDLSGDFTRTWIKSIEDGKVYYYYRYKISKEESTTNLVESVTFNPKFVIPTQRNCVSDDENHSTSCRNTNVDYSNSHYKLTAKVETVQYSKYRDAWNTNVNINNTSISNLSEFVDSLIVTDYVENDDPEGNARFIGENPNNYVSFNDELWRIIGSFDGRVKIIRANRLNSTRPGSAQFAWDSSDNSINNGYGVNEWSQADLMYELNGDYLNYNLTEDPEWYYYFESKERFDHSQSLKQDAQDLIDDAVWHLGASDHSVDYWGQDYTALNIFNNERAGLHTYVSGEKYYYASDKDDTVERQSTWTGKVALMYPSDFLYATSGNEKTSRTECLSRPANNGVWYEAGDCGKNTWLQRTGGDREWTITPGERYTSRSGVTRINSGGVSMYSAQADSDVRPTVYLKSDVIITGGTGKQTDPFTIGL